MFYKTVSDDKKPYLTVSEEECKAYADTHGYNYSLDNIKNNSNDCQAWADSGECTANSSYMWGNCKKACYEKFNPKGCVIRNNDVWFNKKESDRKCGEQSIKCIQKRHYTVGGSGLCDKPEDIVPRDECKQAAIDLGYKPREFSLNNGGEHAQSGCFMDSNILFHFDNKWKGDNYKKVGGYGGRTYICKSNR